MHHKEEDDRWEEAVGQEEPLQERLQEEGEEGEERQAPQGQPCHCGPYCPWLPALTSDGHDHDNSQQYHNNQRLRPSDAWSSTNT